MPAGAQIDISGLKAEAYFVKDLLNKLGIKADFVALGDYKSAPDRLTKSEPTKFDREQIERLLKSGVQELKSAILKSRPALKTETLEALMDRGLFTAKTAKENGLIDEIAYFNEVEDQLTAQGYSSLGWRNLAADYSKTRFYDDSWSEKPIIAVVVLAGEINSGASHADGIFRSGSIGSDTLSETFRKIKYNSHIKGLVIRIDSPGGSSLASDILWNEIRSIKKERAKEKFPIIISIGNVAASGGYYIAVAGDEILASATSITGSIGIFTGKFNLKGLYDWLGIKKHTFKTHKNSAIFSETDSFTDEERVLIKEHLNEFYELFLSRVAMSRGKSSEQIKPLAGGHVYSGTDAISNKLVDKRGGLLLALEIARQNADIDPNYYQVLMLPSEGQNIFSLGDPTQLILPGVVKEASRLIGKSEKIHEEKMLFLMPYELDIR